MGENKARGPARTRAPNARGGTVEATAAHGAAQRQARPRPRGNEARSRRRAMSGEAGGRSGHGRRRTHGRRPRASGYGPPVRRSGFRPPRCIRRGRSSCCCGTPPRTAGRRRRCRRLQPPGGEMASLFSPRNTRRCNAGSVARSSRPRQRILQPQLPQHATRPASPKPGHHAPHPSRRPHPNPSPSGQRNAPINDGSPVLTKTGPAIAYATPRNEGRRGSGAQ